MKQIEATWNQEKSPIAVLYAPKKISASVLLEACVSQEIEAARPFIVRDLCSSDTRGTVAHGTTLH